MSFDELCSSFFGRPLLMQYQEQLIRSLRTSSGRLAHYKSFQQYETADKSYNTKQPLRMSCCRREDYLRLPFVDDLRLRDAMQGFLTGDSSHKARLTRRRHIRPSNCERCHSEKILLYTCHFLKLT